MGRYVEFESRATQDWLIGLSAGLTYANSIRYFVRYVLLSCLCLSYPMCSCAACVLLLSRPVYLSTTEHKLHGCCLSLCKLSLFCRASLWRDKPQGCCLSLCKLSLFCRASLWWDLAQEYSPRYYLLVRSLARGLPSVWRFTVGTLPIFLVSADTHSANRGAGWHIVLFLPETNYEPPLPFRILIQ